MKILIISDIHCEFGSNFRSIIDKDQEFDALVMAGDVSISVRLDVILKEICDFISPKKLFYVTGNHDHYYSNYADVEDLLLKLQDDCDNFVLLNSNVIECEFNNEKIYFIGATGWQTKSHFTKDNFPSMNDFRKIKEHNILVQTMGALDKQFLEESLEEYKNKKVVVVTHIPPTEQSYYADSKEVSDKGYYLDAYFNDWDKLIVNYSPALWICGHLHDSYDGMYNNTRIVRNAYGYEDVKTNPSFKKDFIIEI